MQRQINLSGVPQSKAVGRSTKLFLIAGLGALAWVSTFVGMLELIEANLGKLDLVFRISIGGSVAMLMLMIIWLLDQMFNENNHWFTRTLYVAGYLFLALISIGFSFGFYWKFLESRNEGTRVAETAVTQVQSSLNVASVRLEQLQNTLISLQGISLEKAEAERLRGDSCPNSRPGDGPRRRLREADAASFATAAEFVKGRVGAIKGDIAALEGDLAKILTQDKSTFDASGTRNEFMKALGRKLDMTVTGFNAFRSDPQLQQFRADFASRAEQSSFSDENGKTFSCPDAQLQAALRGAVKAIDALPEVAKPEIHTVEGANATIEAFRRLTVTLISLAQFKLPTSPDDIRSEQLRAVQSAGKATSLETETTGLGQRDYIPLAIAVFVDVCLLLVKIPVGASPVERTRRRRERLSGEAYRSMDNLHAIHQDEETRERLEPLRHVAFTRWSDDYVAVPLVASLNAISPEPATRRMLLLPWFTRDDELPAGHAPLTDEDLQEAQYVADFFASYEKQGPYKRLPVAAFSVSKQLRKIGSKWAGVGSYRLYKFRKGAYSDFIYDVVIGADESLKPIRDALDRRRRKLAEIKSDEIMFEAERRQVEHTARIEDMRHQAEVTKLKREHDAQLDLMRVESEQILIKQKMEQARREAMELDLELHPDEAAEHGARTRQGHGVVKDFLDALTGKRSRRAETEPSRRATRRQADAETEAETETENAKKILAAAEAQAGEVAALKQSVSELALMVKELAQQSLEHRRTVHEAVTAASRIQPNVGAGEMPGHAASGAPGVNGSNGAHGIAGANGHHYTGTNGHATRAPQQAGAASGMPGGAASGPHPGQRGNNGSGAATWGTAGHGLQNGPSAEGADPFAVRQPPVQAPAPEAGPRGRGRGDLPPYLRPLAEAMQRDGRAGEAEGETVIALPPLTPVANDHTGQPRVSSPEEVDRFIAASRSSEPRTQVLRVEPELTFGPQDGAIVTPSVEGQAEAIAEDRVEIVPPDADDMFAAEDAAAEARDAWEAAGPDWHRHQGETLSGGEDAEFATENADIDHESITQWFRKDRGRSAARR